MYSLILRMMFRCLKDIFSSQTFFPFNPFMPGRVRSTDLHCCKMQRNNKFGAKKNNLATTIDEKLQENFLSGVGIVTSGYKSLPRAA